MLVISTFPGVVPSDPTDVGIYAEDFVDIDENKTPRRCVTDHVRRIMPGEPRRGGEKLHGITAELASNRIDRESPKNSSSAPRNFSRNGSQTPEQERHMARLLRLGVFL